MAETVQERIWSHLEREPSRPALAFVDARGAVDWSTRERVFGEAAAAAGAMAEQGLRAGDVAVVVSADPRECAILVLALLTGGAVPLLVAPPAIQGVNTSLRDVIVDVVKRTAARLAVLPRSMQADQEALAAAAPATRMEIGAERLLDGGPRPPGHAQRSSSDVFGLQLTSGTTGFPRVAVWKQDRAVAALDGMAVGMGLSQDDVCFNWTPLYHDMGLVNNLLLCLTRGVPLALMSPLDFVRKPALWLRGLHDTGATVTWSPNFGYALAAERIDEGALDGVSLAGVRAFYNAAERIHLETCARFQRRFQDIGVGWTSMKANFGCVETIGGATFTGPDRELAVEYVDRETLHEQGVARVVEEPADSARGEPIVGCGRPYPGLELAILGPQCEQLPDGVVGEVGTRAKACFSEYLGQPAETAATLQGEYVLTGDLGYLRDGELFWTGRSRERINLQGRKVDPSELERVLLTLDGLRKGCFAAFGVEEAERGTEVLVLLAELETPASDDLAGLAARTRRAVATQLGVTVEELALVPKGTLTKTSSGKRRHLHFRELYLQDRLEVLHRSRAGRLS